MAKSDKTWPKCPACSKEFGKQSAVDDHLKAMHPDWTPDTQHAAETQERFEAAGETDAHSAQPAEAAAVDAAIDEVAAGHGLTREEFDSVIEAPAVHVGEPAKLQPLPLSQGGAQPAPFRTVPSGTKPAIPANAEALTPRQARDQALAHCKAIGELSATLRKGPSGCNTQTDDLMRYVNRARTTLQGMPV